MQLLLFFQLQPVLKELNDLLNDEKSGGGASGGHNLTIGLHLLLELKSHRSFIDFFTNRFAMIKEVQCLRPFHEQLKVGTCYCELHFPT